MNEKERELFPRYRFVAGLMNLFGMTLTHSVFLLVAPILVYLAVDFNVDIATAGYASTLHIVTMGVFLLIGPVLVGKFDCRLVQLIGIGIMIGGLIISYFSNNFTVFLISRVITGMGHGISGSCTNSVVAEWFPPRERSAVITIDGLGIVGITTFAYTAVVPLYHAFGDSWRKVMLLIAGVLAVIWVLWLIFYRNNTKLMSLIAEENKRVGKKVNAFSGMKEALSRRDVWMLCLFMGMASIAANGIDTYLPQFLQNVRGYTDAAASSVVGVTTAIGAIGTLVGGIVTTALGRRKIIILPCLVCGTAFLAVSLISGAPMMINIMFFAYIIFTNFRTPASQTVATELRGATPALVSGAAAMSFAIGFIGTFVCAPLYSFSLDTFGAENSMLVFVPLLVLSLVFAILMPETGPKAQKQKT